MRNFLLVFLFAISTLTAYSQGSGDDALAMQYYQNGELDKALDLYERLFKRNATLYYDQYLNTLLKLKRHNEAEKLTKVMMKSYPDNYSYRIDFGRVLQEQGEQEKAAEWYTSLLNNLPKNEDAIRELSVTFYRSDAFDYSIKTLLNGRKLLKDDALFTYELITLYRYQKNVPMLIQEYLTLLSFSEVPEQALNQAKNNFSAVLETPEQFDLLKTGLLKRIQKDPQNIHYAQLLTWVYLQQKEFDLALRQTVSIDKRLKEEGDRVYDLCILLISNKAYSTAIEALQYLIAKGNSNQYYIPAKIQVLNLKHQQLAAGKINTTDLSALEREYTDMLQEFGRNRNTVLVMRQLANLKASYLNKQKEALSLLEEVLRLPALPQSIIAQTKLELADIYTLAEEPWEATLIYSQIEKDYANDPSAQEAKFRNARLSYFQGDFDWAKAQLDVLKSSTSQLIANDALNLSLLIQENTTNAADTNALKKYATADFLILSNQIPRALATLDSINTLYPDNSLIDDIVMARYKIYLKQDNLQEAIKQLELIVQKYSHDIWGDDALFLLGDLYETRLNDPEKAKRYFEKVIVDFPGSLYVTEARKRFRNLRGDSIG